MEKELKDIINWIKKHYKELPESNINNKKLVIFSTGDFGGEYGYGSSDLKAWGVDKYGKLFWAYASGCSCGCSADAEEKDIKIFEVENVPVGETDLLEAVRLFKENKESFKGKINGYSYSDF